VRGEIAVAAATESATVLNFTSPINTAKFSKANTHALWNQRGAESLPLRQIPSKSIEHKESWVASPSTRTFC